MWMEFVTEVSLNMWTNNTPQGKITPPVLKKFNAFEILIPQKVHTESKLLVDLTPEDKDLGLDGSLIDSVSKINYDLLDVFQNMFVTPQHVIPNVNSSKANNDLIDFGNLDKHEKKSTDLDNATKISDQTNKANSSFIQTKSYLSKVLIPPPIRRLNEACSDKIAIISSLENANDILGPKEGCDKNLFIPHTEEVDEDIIEAVLLRQPLKHPINFIDNDIEKVNHKSETINTTTSIPRNYGLNCHGFSHNKPTTFNEAPLNASENDKILFHNIYGSKTINYQSNDSEFLSNKYKLNVDESSDYFSMKNKGTDNFQTTSGTCSNGLNGYKMSQIPITTSSCYAYNPMLNIDTAKCNKNVPITPLLHYFPVKDKAEQCINLRQDITNFIIKTVKRDEKLYAKSRIVHKNEKEKLHYTNGASIFEKNIVLPQIMQRLSLRKESLDERKNIRRKLILDRGASSFQSSMLTDESTFHDSVHIMPDCKQERLQALLLGRKFENFVKTGSYDSS